MKHLSALDALFLQLETADTPMHVGSLMLLERPRGRRTPYRAIRDHVAGRTHLAPVFSRRLHTMPGDLANPVWLQETQLDLDYHLKQARLPRPGTQEQRQGGVAVALTSTELRKRGFALGPRTRLNAAIGPARDFVALRIPLAEGKEIARHFEAKLNDAVLAICAGALRRHFARDRAALARAMIAAVPVSLRAPGDTSQANYVSMMLVGLATNIADPVERMQAIRAASTRAKTLTGSMKGAIPTDMPSLGIPWLMAGITPLFRKAAAANRIPVVANVAISSVPGPQMPLFLAGGELRAYFPVSIVTHGLGLNITIVSYNGSLDFGLVAAKKAMPQLRRFAAHLESAHAELLEIARTSPETR